MIIRKLQNIQEDASDERDKQLSIMEELTYSGYKVWFFLKTCKQDIFSFERKDCVQVFSKNVYYRGIDELISKQFLKHNNGVEYVFIPFPNIMPKDEQPVWIVYMLKFPDDTKYIGITSKELDKRCGTMGENYKNMRVYEAIEKFGWDNAERVILQTGLTEKEARLYEQLYIKEYNTTILNKGYNVVERRVSVATIKEELNLGA